MKNGTEGNEENEDENRSQAAAQKKMLGAKLVPGVSPARLRLLRFLL